MEPRESSRKVRTFLILFACFAASHGAPTYLTTRPISYITGGSYRPPTKYKLIGSERYVSPYDGRVYYKAEAEPVDPAYYEYDPYRGSNVEKPKYLSDHLLKQLGEDFSDYYHQGRYPGPKDIGGHMPHDLHSKEIADLELGMGGYPVVPGTSSYGKSYGGKMKGLDKAVSSVMYKFADGGGHMYPGKNIEMQPGAYYKPLEAEEISIYKSPVEGEKYPSSHTSYGEGTGSTGRSELYSPKPVKGYFDYRTGRHHGIPLGGYGYPRTGRHLGFYQR